MPPAQKSVAPDALLLLATTCPHCPKVLESLSQLVKEGHIGALEAVNVGLHPERAQQLGVRTVPWFRIGYLVFEGLHTKQELLNWAGKATSDNGVGDYIEYLLTGGMLQKAIEFIQNNEKFAPLLLGLMQKPDININVQIGISAIMEHFRHSDVIKKLTDGLGRLTRETNSRLRSDACYYLSLTGDSAAQAYVEPLLDDENQEVREIAEEALLEIKNYAVS